MPIPKTTSAVRIKCAFYAASRKNIAIIAISMGKRPLHGTKLFVIMAIRRSLGESIILHPTMPAALQPKPMHIVSACFPHAQHFFEGFVKIKGNSWQVT